MTRPGRVGWWAVAAIAAGGLLLSLVTLVRPAAPTLQVEAARGPASVTQPESTAAPLPSEPAGRRVVSRRPAVLPASGAAGSARPAGLRVPAVGVDVRVVPVGVEPSGEMELPDDPGVVGWYRFGPRPGEGVGSAVLAGHVDSERYGVGPLAALGGTRPGDRVLVRLGPRWVDYRVDSVEQLDRRALPAAVFARTGPERLRIITCTGPYLPEAGGYQQNLVVTAVPTG
jgi:sortase (surface protein transpeptidase)